MVRRSTAPQQAPRRTVATATVKSRNTMLCSTLRQIPRIPHPLLLNLSSEYKLQHKTTANNYTVQHRKANEPSNAEWKQNHLLFWLYNRQLKIPRRCNPQPYGNPAKAKCLLPPYRQAVVVLGAQSSFPETLDTVFNYIAENEREEK